MYKKVSHFRAPRSDFARKDRRDWNISKFGIHFGMEKIGTGPQCGASCTASASLPPRADTAAVWGHPLPVLHFLQVWTVAGRKI